MNLRNLCLKILEEVYDDGLFVNDALDAYFNLYDLEKNERAFMNRLVYGTLENQIKLDHVIGQFSTVPVKKIKKTVLYVLRMSLYQILFMDQIPDYSVCDEAVRLIKKRKMGNLSGFVNGMLRNIMRNQEKITYPDRTDLLSYLSINYSYPRWLVRKLLDQYDLEVVEGMLGNSLNVPKLCVRVQNPEHVQQLTKQLEAAGVTVTPGKYLPYALYLEGISAIKSLNAFASGELQIQDESSMLVGALAGIEPGQTILDLCAAPGGKTTHAATLLKGTGKVLSRDISEKKLARIEENCHRLKLNNVEVACADATLRDPALIEAADVVLTDVPCSGLGIIRRKPDIKYNVNEDGIKALLQIQAQILEQAAVYVKPGGTLMYSTCTVNREENQEQVDAFLRRHVEFKAEPMIGIDAIGADCPYVQLLPLDALSDGFFIAKLKRML